MSTIQDAKQVFAGLSRDEKAEVVHWANRDLFGFPLIESTPDVCGGEPCIIRTRIPVWILENWRRLGSSDAEILSNYPTLRALDLVEAWSYVLAHPKEIDDQIKQNEEA